MRKIAIVGPESSGKTTLAQDLAQRLACPWVAEYVREYFATRADASYDLQDIIEIARGQLAAEHAAPASTDLICDTNGLVCKIWAEVRFGVCPPELAMLWPAADYALHVLVRPDIPWEPDPLRENPTDRDWLFGLYATALEAAGVPWISVGGTRADRVDMVLATLQH